MRIMVLDEAGESAGQAGPAFGSAADLARRLGLGLTAEAPEEDALLLVRTTGGLELREAGVAAATPLRVEFRLGGGSATLRKATLAGRRGTNRIVDATAGLGQDSFALAEWGCRVELIERSPIVAALLADGLRRAAAESETRDAAARMELHQADALELLPSLAPAEVVYLDPMYPRSGREGRKGKGMRLLRAILGDDPDADSLLDVARRTATRRVVVKRPLKAPPLAGVKPSGSLPGTTVRYDLYGPLLDPTEQEGAR